MGTTYRFTPGFRRGMCHESGLLRQPARAGTGPLLQLRLGGGPCQASATLASGRAMRVHADCGQLVQGLGQKDALLTGLRTVWLDELALYRRLRALGALPTALDQTAYQADDPEHPWAIGGRERRRPQLGV